jgi:hypothetical protein
MTSTTPPRVRPVFDPFVSRTILSIFGVIDAVITVIVVSRTPLWPTTAIPARLETTASWIGTASTFGFLVAYAILTFVYHTKSLRPPGKNGPRLNFDHIREGADRISQHMDRPTALFFRDLVAFPARHVDRLTEVIEPLSRSTLVRSSYTILLPEDLPEGIVTIALHVQPKGLLETGMKFFNQLDHEIPPFSQQQSLSYICAAIRYLVSEMGAPALAKYSANLEAKVVRAIAIRMFKDAAETASWLQEFEGSLRLIVPEVKARASDLEAIVAITDILRSSMMSRVSCVDIERDTAKSALGSTVRVSVERRNLNHNSAPPEGVAFEGFLRRQATRLRAFFGVLPTVITHSLDNAERARSYHLEVHGPPGTYIARQEVRERVTGAHVDLSGLNYAFTKRVGQRHSHFYARGTQDFKNRVLVNNFYERMPGSMGSSALSAVASAVLIWLCALTTAGWQPDAQVGKPPQITDLVAILLAFPIVISLWAGFDRGETLGDVLVARVTKVITILLSVAAAILYVLGPIPEGSTHVGWEWPLLVGAATLNAAATGASWIMRAIVHLHFVTRPVRQNTSGGDADLIQTDQEE